MLGSGWHSHHAGQGTLSRRFPVHAGQPVGVIPVQVGWSLLSSILHPCISPKTQPTPASSYGSSTRQSRADGSLEHGPNNRPHSWPLSHTPRCLGSFLPIGKWSKFDEIAFLIAGVYIRHDDGGKSRLFQLIHQLLGAGLVRKGADLNR